MIGLVAGLAISVPTGVLVVFRNLHLTPRLRLSRGLQLCRLSQFLAFQYAAFLGSTCIIPGAAVSLPLYVPPSLRVKPTALSKPGALSDTVENMTLRAAQGCTS